jgi:[ribosomal protein S18]-alanine N-acetyltransferase
MFYCTKAESPGTNLLQRSHMSLYQATATDLPSIRQLLERARQVYKTVGHEDLNELLKSPLGIIGADQGKIWGYVHVQLEERPVSLPAAAPQRAFLRLVALAPGRSPSVDTTNLLNTVCAAVGETARPVQVICFGGESWLTHALTEAGFALSERVQYYRLERLNRWSNRQPPPPELRLRPAHPDDLPALAQLDSDTFDSLWHMDAKGLWQLFFTYRVQVALWQDELVGYAAVAVNGAEAQLARLAVHPHWQGRGIGRHLLTDALHYAQMQEATEMALNTQASNLHAQALYRQFGFRSTGVVDPVFTRLLA